MNLHLHRYSLPLIVVGSIVAGACTAPADLHRQPSAHRHTKTNEDPSSDDASADPSAGKAAGLGTGADLVVSSGASGTKKTSLANLTPRQGQRITSPRQALDDGPFTAETPTIRANDRHASPVTGKDCMSCHGSGGTAPHFAYGGTMSLGKNWVWGTPAWSTSNSASAKKPDSYYGDGYGYGYDNYGGYDDYGGYCGYGDGDYDQYGNYGSYKGYGDSDYGQYGDYGDYGGTGGCGKQGWPEDRTAPAAGAGVRLVGDDGMVFDTLSDEDGNFWFKSTEDVKMPAFTGIKYGAFSVTGSTNGVACGSCHESGAKDSPGRLWVWNGATPKAGGLFQ
jgi:hypothetical protein